MLDYWYSERCNRQIRLIICISTCVLIYMCTTVAQLSTTLTLLCLAMGIGLHFLYQLKSRISVKAQYQRGINILIGLLPFIVLLNLILWLPQEHQVILLLQCLGFIALGLFTVSIYDNRARRHE